VQRLIELNAKHSPVAIVYDGAGPANTLAPELEAAGIEVAPVNAKEHASACGLIFDLVEQKRLRHLGTERARNALKGAAKRALGDAWAWHRKSSSVDITPLVSLTLALWGASSTPEKPAEVMEARLMAVEDQVEIVADTNELEQALRRAAILASARGGGERFERARSRSGGSRGAGLAA
jgi:hypothetical protein